MNRTHLLRAHDRFGIRRIVFDRAHLQGRPEFLRVLIDLVSDDPLPEDWFNPQAHHLTAE
jgi:hypothetical protein